MPGVIFLLDEASNARIESLWDEMEREFGVPKGFPGALPHLTAHLAGGYILEAVRAVIEATVATKAPFTVPTAGLGVFTGELPILYIPVIRTPMLSALHAHLHISLAAHCVEPEPYYAPERWMPHITVGQVDLNSEIFPSLLHWLAQQPLSWDIHVPSLAIGENTETGVALFATFPLLE